MEKGGGGGIPEKLAVLYIEASAHEKKIVLPQCPQYVIAAKFAHFCVLTA